MIAAIIGVADFKFSLLGLMKWATIVDYMVLRFDTITMYHKTPENQKMVKTWFDLINDMKPFQCEVDAYISDHPWGGNSPLHWNEEMLRRLDKLMSCGDLVVPGDCDEYIGGQEGEFFSEIGRLINSDCNALMFSFVMLTDDKRIVPTLPWCDHCKVFKWENGVTYKDSPGFCVPNYGRPIKRMKSSLPLIHFPMYTKEMEIERMRYYSSLSGNYDCVFEFYGKSGLEVPEYVLRALPKIHKS